MFSAVVRDFACFLILLGVERVCCVRALRNTHDVSEARGRVSAAFGTEIARLRRSKARKISRENARTRGKFWLILAHRQCKTRPACTACAAQHARRQRSSRLSQRCIWSRDCASSTFESAQNFARKRLNVWQILFHCHIGY